MYIVVSNLGKKLKTLGKVLVFLLALGVLIPGAIALYNNYAPAVSTWLQEKSQEVGPMRTEPMQKTWFDQVVDQYVIKLQDFYYEERE
ncbi:MAG: hypothetical protein GX052_09225 [Syntrophomonadaceae bacterium]|jgi:hypothetical protein|nr:hypothetical protein [Syntrophomonadaceae bacterium]